MRLGIGNIVILVGLILASVDALSQTVAFRNVNVITMRNETVLLGQTVVVEDGRIKTIGSNASSKLPANAIVVDGSGKYLMPGLADMHVHIWDETDLTLYLSNGVTRVRNLNGRPYHLTWRKQIADGSKFGPNIYTSGPTMYGQLWVRTIDTEEKAIESVRQQKAMGYDFVKVYHMLAPNVYAAATKTAKSLGMRVVGHKPARVPMQTVIDSGQECLEHLLGYGYAVDRDDSPLRAQVQQGGWSFRYSYAGIDADPTKITRVAKQAADNNIWNCPTLVVMDRWVPNGTPEMTEIKSNPYWQYIPSSKRNGSVERYGVTFEDYTLEYQQQGMKVRRQIVKALHDAGAGLLLGTDAGANTVVAGFSIHEELVAMVEAGLTPYQALATGTTSISLYLKTPDVGHISRGAKADMLLLNANPLDDIDNTKKIAGVMKDGRWYPKSDLDERLANIASSYNN